MLNPTLFLLCVISLFTRSSSTLVTSYYSQPVDHFGHGSVSRLDFKQRVFLDFTYCPGSQGTIDGAPILVFFGGEANVETWIGDLGIGPGILILAAEHFQALIVYIEHHFYGQSVPYGSTALALRDTEVRGCLTSLQALADSANVITTLKKKLSSPKSPVIVMGGSYAGRLAAWFRFKYPHIAVGALASSAPLISPLEVPLNDKYCSKVSQDFKDTNRRCFEYISKSWKLIDEMALRKEGLVFLGKKFKTCSPLFAAYELKTYLADMYRYVAQYNGKFNRLKDICDEITSVGDDDILEGISRATFLFTNPQICNNISGIASFLLLDPESLQAWDWQMCSELVPNFDECSNSSMFEPHAFNLSTYKENCRRKYGVVYPHSDWLSSYYGGKDIKTTLRKFGSNIIFSSGLKDPLSGASIVEDISETIVAITTQQGSHSLDLTVMQHDDPKWLKNQRNKELEVMSKWINKNRGFKMRLSDWFILFTGIAIVLIIGVKLYLWKTSTAVGS